MNRKLALAAAIATSVLAAIAILVLWLTDPNSSGRLPQVADAGERGATATAAGTSLEVAPTEAAPGTGTAERTEVRDTIQVTGRLAEQRAVTLYLESATGAILKLGRSDSEGTFQFAMPLPLCDVGVHTIESDSQERRQRFTRAAEAGRTDWDLGQVTFPGLRITVRLQLDYDDATVAALLATEQQRVTARVRDSRDNGPVLGERTFVLDELPKAAQSCAHDVLCESHDPSGTVVVAWTCGPLDRPQTMHREDKLAAHLGAHRTSVLALRSEAVVRGRVLWADGSPWRWEQVQYTSDVPRGPLYQQTTDDGAFVFITGLGDRGKVNVSSPIAYFCQEPGRPAEAGKVMEIRTGFVPLRLRLLGDGGLPVERFRINGLCQLTQESRDHHPGGVSLQVRQCLERVPLLEFVVDERLRAFLVPASWFTDPVAIHDVHMADFLPVGSLRVNVTGAAPPDMIELKGLGPLTGVERYGHAPTQGPWGIADLPAGDYEYSAWRKSNVEREGRISIVAGHEAELRLP